ncbi:MAG: S8 family serine peptidase [bacterium]|jgi:subtilisin family serine protease|nr:S8 family serine peptidase [candidate division KSB1 bacterium]MDH7559011.1 S8 family serine peptidase [bacterium]
MTLGRSVVWAVVLLALVDVCVPADLSESQRAKLDPCLRMVVLHPDAVARGAVPGTALMKTAPEQYLRVLIQVRNGFSGVLATGAQVQAVVGNVATALVTEDELLAIIGLDEVVYVQAPKARRLQLDRSVPEIGVTAVRSSSGLTGKNTVLGIVDTGIDWRHADFRHNNGTTRIKYLLDFSDPGDVNGDNKLDGPDDYGGTLHTEAEINTALQGGPSLAHRDVVGHGTHVAGCAGGNGRATGRKQPAGQYVGVAPEAAFVIVKGTRVEGADKIADDDQVNALHFVHSKAGELGMPYVVNLSLGSNWGAHDGTDVAEQAIDQLVGPGRPGRAVVVAAGNDGQENIHTSGTLSPATRSVTIRTEIAPYDKNSATQDDYLVLDFWYSGFSNQSITVTTPAGRTYGPFLSGRLFYEDTKEGFLYIDNAHGGVNPRNGDKELLIQIYDRSAGSEPAAGTWELTISGTSGRFDGWIAASSMEARFVDHVDHTMKVSIPGTAQFAITVGSYITKRTWVDLDGHTLTSPGLSNKHDGELSDFSNPGPTRDDRTKPEVAAPGEKIAAALSADADPSQPTSMFYTGSAQFPNGFILPDGVHAISQGTSMAAPHVAGVVALALERDPTLTCVQIRQMLQDSARRDAFTGMVPNNSWGYGKVWAGAVIALPPQEGNLPTAFRLFPGYPNPFVQSTVIRYEFPQDNLPSDVSIAIFDTRGRQVRTIRGGRTYVVWNGRDDAGAALASGVYFCRLRAGSYSGVRKLVLLR